MAKVRAYFNPRNKIWCACVNNGPWGHKRPFACAAKRETLCKMLERRYNRTAEMIRRGEERRARLRAENEHPGS